MREDLDKRLCAEFPLLYRDRHGDKMKTCMCWGFPGDGWFHLLYRLSAKLEPLIAAQPEEKRAVAAQVKEKFGGLRFYMDFATKEMNSLINEAELEALRTCEMCGVPGEQRSGGWIKTLCNWCVDERKREMKALADKYKAQQRERERAEKYREQERKRKEEKGE